MFPSLSSLLGNFIVNGFLVNTFSASIEKIIYFFPLTTFVALIIFHMEDQACVSEIKPDLIWVVCIIHFIPDWLDLSLSCLEVYYLCSETRLAYNFLFFKNDILIRFYIKVMLALQNDFLLSCKSLLYISVIDAIFFSP